MQPVTASLSRFLPLTAVVLLALGCLFIVLTSFESKIFSWIDLYGLRPPLAPVVVLPTLCAHRIVGDESAQLGISLPDAMDSLFARNISCFDADVVR